LKSGALDRESKEGIMQKITPCLWFDSQAEDAANYYVSIFENSKITDVSRYGEGAPVPAGTAIVVEFELDGVAFQALNGGPAFNFTEAVSFSVEAPTQEEVDYLWDTLTADGGEPGRCGWLKDKYGVSWQIVPPILGELMADPDSEKASRVMQAMLAMGKIIISELQDAYNGR
jgi:predicted 3-demethylubiquinone-9 3-methyltransferase (glyoxalase superfamily)